MNSLNLFEQEALNALSNLNRKGGYVLEQLQLLNWGPFNEKVWTFKPDGQRSLMIGDNGAGKSTVSDALMALLVPNAKSHFNKATGEKNNDRDFYTYVRGMFGTSQDVLSKSSQSDYLRSENAVSILVAVWRREGFERSADGYFTTGQILTAKPDEANKVKRVYVSAYARLNIIDDFAPNHSDSRVLRKHLQERDPESLVTTTATEYYDSVCNAFGFEGRHVLTFLARAAYLKDIPDLDTFVRENLIMLPANERDEDSPEYKIQQIKSALENCKQIEKKIRDTETLIADFKGLLAQHDFLIQKAQEKTELELIEQVGTHFIYSTQVEFISKDLEQIEAEKSKAETELQRLETELKTKRGELAKILQQLNQTDSSKRILQQSEVKRLQEKQTQVERDSEAFGSYLSALMMSKPKNTKEFDERMELIGRKNLELAAEQGKNQDQRDELRAKKTALGEQASKLEEQLKALSMQRGNIPYTELEFRGRIARLLNVGEEELPFLAELVQVRESQKQWKPAIEALLGDSRTQFLVPRRLKEKVDALVSPAERKAAVSYMEVSEVFTARDLEEIPGGVVSKLEFMTQNPLWQAAKAYLVQAKDAHCVSDTSEFQDKSNALTVSGLSKRGKQRKGFSTNFMHNSSNWRLGWSNLELKANKEQELLKTKDDLDLVETQLLRLAESNRKIEAQVKFCDRLITQFNEFTKVDLDSVAAELTAAQTLLAELDAKEDKSRDLRLKADALQTEINELDAKAKASSSELGALGARIKSCSEALSQAQASALPMEQNPLLFIGTDEPTELYERLLAQCRESMSKEARNPGGLGALSTLGVITENTIKRDLSKPDSLIINWNTRVAIRRNELSSEEGGIASDIRNRTQSINNVHRNALESHEAYPLKETERVLVAEILEKEEGQSLVGLKIELALTFNAGLSRSIKNLNERLNDLYEEVQDSVESINEVLSRVDFDKNGRVLCMEALATKDEQIKRFRKKLKDICIRDVEVSEEARDQFRIEAEELVERFTAEDEQSKRWLDNVTDPRNWYTFQFKLRKRDGSRDETLMNVQGEREVTLASTSRGSGGERERLAYTLLVAAAMIQLGLHSERRKFLRFMILDECFSKSSGETASRPLRLMQEVNLQTCLLTPMEKIDVIEPYVEHFAMVVKQVNASTITNMTIQKFRESEERRRAYELVKRRRIAEAKEQGATDEEAQARADETIEVATSVFGTRATEQPFEQKPSDLGQV